MISSTARDLPEHRDEVRKGCHRAGFASDQMMENLTALDKDAVEISLKMVEVADIYLGIFAYRYGYVPDGSDISITEMEYDKAVELGKPRLVFLIHEDHPVTGKDFEHGEGSAKLLAFKERVGKERVVAFFKSPGDLRGHVVEALIQLNKELEGDQKSEPKAAAKRLHRRTPIPVSPTPYIAHPYTLSQTRDLVGRREELNALTDWVTKEDSPAYDAALFCFVAIGGMGKSALTWKWFNDIAPEEMPDLAGRLWWSFYESDAHFENFLNRALCYVGELSEDEVREMPWQDRETLLLQHLSEKKFLFVLDGLERILLAYNRMDASSLADDEYDEETANTVAGAAGLPASAAQSFTGQHRLRQTTDPRAGHFFKNLAQVEKSRILISTRLYPLALQLPNTEACPGCHAYFLMGLRDDDAIALWRKLGVSGSRQELVTVFRSFESHALLVQALAGEIARDRKTPGDFDGWRKNNPSFDPASLQATQAKSHILQYALAGLDEDMRETLTSIVALRTPASYDTLEALLVGNGKAFTQRQALDRALTELEDRGLIGWDREANRYDAHPIVRAVGSRLKNQADQDALSSAIDEHFAPMVLTDEALVRSLDDLAPAIERYHQLVKLRRFDDAFDLLHDHVINSAFKRFSAFRDIKSWVEQLFPYGIDENPPLNSIRAQSYTINLLGLCFQNQGLPVDAMSLLKRRLSLAKQIGDRVHTLIAQCNLGFAYRQNGNLFLSNFSLREALNLSRDLKETKWENVSLQLIGNLHSNFPLTQQTRTIIARSYLISVKKKESAERCRSVIGLCEQALREGKLFRAERLADLAWLLAERSNIKSLLILASYFQGRVSLANGDLAMGRERLNYSLLSARTAGDTMREINALIAISELEVRNGRHSEARSGLQNVWDIADECFYPIRQAEAHNVLAEICLAEGDKPGAIVAATKAYRAAWCDGPPWAYHWELEKAKTHLQALNAPEPDMPPFDESKYDPMPKVEINPEDEYWVDPSEPLEALLDLP